MSLEALYERLYSPENLTKAEAYLREKQRELKEAMATWTDEDRDLNFSEEDQQIRLETFKALAPVCYKALSEL